MYFKNKKILLFLTLIYFVFSIQIVYANGNSDLKYFSITGLSGIGEPIILVATTPEDEDDIVEIYVDGIIDINEDIVVDDETNIKVVVLDNNDSNQKKEYNIIVNRLPMTDNDPVAIFDYMEYTDEVNGSAKRTRKNIYVEETQVIIDKSTIIVGIDLYVKDRVEDVKVKFNDMILDYSVMDYGYILEMGNKKENQFIIELLGEDGKTKIYKIIFVKADKELEFRIDELEYRIDGNVFRNDVAPIVENGRTIVPVRIVAESLDADVEWIQKSKQVVLKKDGKEIRIEINKPLENNMGEAKIINNKVYVPIRYIAEELGASVTYDEQLKLIQIYQ